MLKRYSILALIALAVEVLLLYLFRIPLKETARVPRTYEEITSANTFFSASILPDLFSASTQVRSEELKKKLLSEEKFVSAGLVNLKSLDSSISVNLKYSGMDNFLNKNLYGELKNCYLQNEIADKLVKAQKLLKEKYPFYSLIVYDGARPVAIQQTMWDELLVPEKLKDKYVSNPEVGSLHNFGCAVDVCIINENGWELDMGTPYDYFGELAHPAAEQRMIKEGKLTWRQYENRKLLREVMISSGFTSITTEWWHFNGASLKQAGEKYALIK